MDIDEECMAQMFQTTLTGPAAQWFSKVETDKLRSWEDIANIFVKQYSYNAELEVTLRDLEDARQEPKEKFADFVRRFRSVAAKIINWPNEEDQMNLLVRNLQPNYYRHISGATLIDFGHLYKTGVRVEERMRNGLLENVGVRETKKSYGGSSSSLYGGGGNSSYTNRTAEVNLVGHQPNRPRDQPRTFTDLGAPMSVILKRFMAKDLLRPVGPVPVADPPPTWFNRSQYCAFHEQVGHPTDRCPRLRHEIEDLIQKGIVPKPPAKPNVIDNPMPNHAVPPPEGM